MAVAGAGGLGGEGGGNGGGGGMREGLEVDGDKGALSGVGWGG